jgi:hypothetical protein
MKILTWSIHVNCSGFGFNARSMYSLCIPLKCFIFLQNQTFARALMPPPPLSSKSPVSFSKSTYNAGHKYKNSRASTGSDSANNTYNAGSRNKNKNIWPSTLPDTSKRPRYQGASSASGDLGRPRSVQQARSGPSSSSTSYENTKSSVSDGPVQPTKPKRKRRPKKKKT